MNGNPYYVQPVDVTQGLSSLGQGLSAFKQQQDLNDQKDQQLKQQEANKARMAELQSIVQTGDMEKVADFMIANSDIQSNVQSNIYKGMNVKDDIQKEQMKQDTFKMLSNPDKVPQLLQERIETIELRGGDATQSRKELEQFSQDPEGFMQSIEGIAASSYSPEYKQWSSAMRGEGEDKTSLPGAVRETEWFLKQTPEVQDSHLKLKRRTDPSMAQKLEQKQKESDIKVSEEAAKTTAKSTATRQQGFIDSGVEAADSLGNIYRIDELLDTVQTGGFDNAALRAKQVFGIESADEAELSAGLGKAILSQLKPIFGAAFTAAEGERLERIEANLGKSTAGNKRLIKEVKRITERAARRGLNAAKAQGDEFAASEIQTILDALKETKSPKAEDKTVLSGMSDADLLKELGV